MILQVGIWESLKITSLSSIMNQDASIRMKWATRDGPERKNDMYFKLDKLRNKKSLLYFIMLSALPIAFLLLVWMAYGSYVNDERTVITQQQQQLLTIAKLTARNLEVSFKEQVHNLEIVAGNRGVALGMANGDPVPVKQAIEAYYMAKNQGIDRICVIDKKGKTVGIYPETSATEAETIRTTIEDEIQNVLREKQALIGEAKFEQPGRYITNIYQPVFLDQEFEGILVSSVDLNAIYELLVKPFRVGKKGYVHVKNDQGVYLMHPNPWNIGKSLESLKIAYPELDFRDLETLMDFQLSEEEGSAVYHSYWWMEQSLEKTKKFEAFSKAHFGGFFWIVAAAMDYEDVKGPIAENRFKTMEIFFMILLILSGAIFMVMKAQKNKKALEVETKYLRELNATHEQIRKKDLQLVHAQKLQVIGTLTGGIAHDFNNLLTPILGYSEIMLNKLSPQEEMYDYANEIYEASEKARNIIEQVLVFSRSDNGKGKYEPSNVAALVEETLKLVEPIITPNIDVVFEKLDGSAVILANKVQIHQVVLNLCTNAYQAMKGQGGTLKVKVETLSLHEARKINESAQDAPRFVKISVSDTGYGMSKETMSQIFDPFFTTKSTGEGTGLGLFIVYGIVESHKGFITVESEVRKGSVFSVYIPQATLQVNEGPSCPLPVPKDSKTVLLIDDKIKVLKAMKKGLEPFGFKIQSESSSVEAIKTVESNPTKFDVIITDQAMPYIKGLDLAERMKTLNPQIKVILVTGFVEEKVVESKERFIIDDYMCKPVTGSELARKIKELFQSAG